MSEREGIGESEGVSKGVKEDVVKRGKGRQKESSTCCETNLIPFMSGISTLMAVSQSQEKPADGVSGSGLYFNA